VKYAHQPTVADADGVKLRHAATVMILADRPELEVLMVRRTSRAVFAPSAWVFPGGRVDPHDALAPDVSHVVHGLDDVAASAALGVPNNGRAWWLAGLRETLEESGLLIGAGDAPADAVERIRTAVQDDAGALVSALVENDVRLDLGELVDVGQFITPIGPPRRFDARFFVALAPLDQNASHDKEEVVEHRWVRPADAVTQWRAGDFPIMSVTHRMLACLQRYESSAAVMKVARSRGPEQRVRVNDPDGEYEVLLPGEPGYETAEVEIEHGWVRI